MPSETNQNAVQPFEVSRIKLLSSPYQEAMSKGCDYLLSLEPDRFLHSFRTNAGLSPKGTVYGGWEEQQLAGHSLGHYLSAISRMHFAAQNDDLKTRATYIVQQLQECQAKDPHGYTAALPDAKPMWDKLRANDPSGVLGYWAPWYTIHKVFAGLIDAHTLLNTPHALDAAKALGDWTCWVTANLTPENWQAMLENEHGGMNESLAHLYALTGEQKYLDAANNFYHKAVLDPLSEGIDDLNGLHANTQIPKIIGCATLYNLKGDAKHQRISTSFWDKVVHHHTYAIGGNSVFEHFGPADKLSETLNPTTCETCNSYNMVKLTNLLFAWKPTAELGDFAERAITNHILASQNHETGMVCYYVTLMPNTSKAFCTPFDSFWCCTGTGMENHARYGESIYFAAKDGLYISQFIPSELDWKEQNARVRMESGSPSVGHVKVTMLKAPAEATSLYIRRPYWAIGEPKITVNGNPVSMQTQDNGFGKIHRTFTDGDTVEAEFTPGYHLWPMPDNPNRAAIFYGPTVLAGNFGTGLDSGTQVPALVTGDQPMTHWLEPRAESPLDVMTNHVGRPQDYKLIPFNQIENQRTTVYWDFLTPDEWSAREKKLEAEKAYLEALNAETIDHLLPGNLDSEKAHQTTSEKSGYGEFNNKTYRDASDGGGMTFVMKAVPGKEAVLTLTFWGSDSGNRVFDVNLDGKTVRTISLDNNRPNEFYREMIPFVGPESGSLKVNLQAKPGAMMGGLFGARTLKPGALLSDPTPAIFDLTKKGEPISPHIYGQFLEHLGHCINQGIWSELLLDRKFFYALGMDGSPWHPVGHPQIAMDPIDPFVGEWTPVIDGGDKGGDGIFQGDIWFKKGATYTGYVWLKGDAFAGPVIVSFIYGPGPRDRINYAIPTIPDRYQKFEFGFVSPLTTTAGRLEFTSGGVGKLFIGTASLMPADNVDGIRPDIVEQMKKLDGTLYRWPGGNFVSGYNWKDGIGDRDRRPPRKNPAWSGLEPNDFGAHEYMKLCELVGFEPLVVVNTGLGTEEMAVEELEYFNGSLQTPMGKLRAAHGHPEPFGVKWWGIGNEMFGDWQLGHIPLKEYTKRHNRFVDAMRKIDPTIRTIAVGDCYSDWSKGMLDNCWNRMDLLSEHFYCQENPDLFAYIDELASQVREKVKIHRGLRDTDPIIKAHPVPITFDEWNYWHGDAIYGELGIRYYWKDGMGVARGLHEMFANSDIVHGANYAQTVNVIGAIKATPFVAWLETTGLALEMYRRHFGVTPISVSEPPTHCSWSAALMPDGKTVSFACINPTPLTIRAVPSGLSGSLPAKLPAVQLSNSDPMAYNDENHTDRIKIETVDLDTSKGIAFPPLSVTIVHLE